MKIRRQEWSHQPSEQGAAEDQVILGWRPSGQLDTNDLLGL